MSKKILIIAGEASGDLHGANLVKNIKSSLPEIEISGLGGQLMQDAGVKLYFNLADIAVLGLGDVLLKYFKFKRIFDFMVKETIALRPDAIILIDYPGFNLRFAKRIKTLSNMPIIYYISPQVWAWGGGRITLIKNIIDKMIVIFKFEKTLYERYDIKTDFVGHPLLDVIRLSLNKDSIRSKFEIGPDKRVVAILPGSREPEVKYILPVMLKSCQIINNETNDKIKFILIKAPTIKEPLIQQLITDYADLNIKIVEDFRYEAISICDLALVASGTATLETAILVRPMIIIYKANFLTYLMTRLVIRIPYIGLVNVIAGKKIIPEFLQYNARPPKIAKQALIILKDTTYAQSLQNDLLKIKEGLGEAGASRRAAKSILDFLYANN